MDDATGLTGVRQVNFNLGDRSRLDDGIKERSPINPQSALLISCLGGKHHPLQREYTDFKIEGASCLIHDQCLSHRRLT